MNDNNSNGRGIDFFGALAIALIVLKLCGVIAWSWLWVFCPLWIPALIIVGIALFAAVVKRKAERDGE